MATEQNVYDLLAHLGKLFIEHEEANQRAFERIEAAQTNNEREIAELRKLVESNAKAIQALADREA